MTNENENNWSNYWQGRTASEAGAALVGVGIESDADIGEFWRQRLGALPKTTRILDLACGAGSVVRRAAALDMNDVTGVDISTAAIAALQNEFPNAAGVVASADDTGLPSASFDLVASQFGFEYAQVNKAASEAARLLKTGGQFLALAHSADSAIEAEVSRNGGVAKDIVLSGFIEAAEALFAAAFSGAPAEFELAAKNFEVPQAKVFDIAKRYGGLAAHLYQGGRTLYERRQAYALSDITAWLSGMQNEIQAFVGRMESMQAAALTEAEASAVLDILAEGGLTPQPLDVFKAKDTGDVLGWVIYATSKT